MPVAADAAAQLVELRQAEPFRVLHNHHARVWNVHPDLDNRSRYQKVQLARGERLHHPVLPVRLHAAVQQPDVIRGEDLGGKMVGHPGGCLEIELRRLLDQRVDHVRLTAGLELLPYERVHFVAARLGLDERLHREPPRRKIADGRHVEVAVDGQRERPRNRGRGHDEHVGMEPFCTQRCALQHTKPVLLVDHHQPQRLEPHVALHQRVRADDQMNRPGLDFGQLFAPCRARGRSGQERHAKPRPLEQARDIQKMLVGQDFGRRHERHLLAVLHGDQRRHERNDRFPRSDVALQEPIHRMRPLQILHDVLERLFLPAREPEGQHASRRLANAVVDADRRGFRFARGESASRDNARLKQERLLENQTALRRRSESIQRVD